MQLTNAIINTTNQTTETNKPNQVSSDNTTFNSLLSEKEIHTTNDMKEGLKNQINTLFGESSFSKALYEELEKEISSSTSKDDYSMITFKAIMIDIEINNTGTKLYEAWKNGEELNFKDRKNANNTNFISEIKDFLSLIDEGKFTDDINLKNSFTDLLTKVLDKTIQYENEKNSILNKNSNTPNPFQVKEIV